MRGPVPEVHQPVGHLGSPARHVERGERVRRLRQRRAQGPVRFAHIGQLAAFGGHDRPRERRTHPGRHQPVQAEAGGVERHDRLAGLEGRRVEGRRAAEPDRVALRGQCCPEGVDTGGPQLAEAGDQGLWS